MDGIEVRELLPSEYKEWDLLVEKLNPVHSFIQVNGLKFAGISYQKTLESTAVSETANLWEAALFL